MCHPVFNKALIVTVYFFFNAVKVNGKIKLGVVSITVDVVSVNVRTFNGNITSTVFFK